MCSCCNFYNIVWHKFYFKDKKKIMIAKLINCFRTLFILRVLRFLRVICFKVLLVKTYFYSFSKGNKKILRFKTSSILSITIILFWRSPSISKTIDFKFIIYCLQFKKNTTVLKTILRIQTCCLITSCI